MKLTHQQIMRVGNEVASVWGAVCVGYHYEGHDIVFECNECGEEFDTTPMTEEEIIKDWLVA